MKRIALIAAIAVAAAVMVGAFAVSSYAFPTLGQPCVNSGCHVAGDPRVAPPDTTQSHFATTTPDASCAVTVCDALAEYHGNAVLHLSTTDNVGGWGVGYIYYKLDKGLVRIVKMPVDWSALMGAHACDATITVTAPATGAQAHTLKFWSQDNYGNVETSKAVTFTVKALTRMPMTIALNRSTAYRGQTVVVSGTVVKPGVRVVVLVKKPGATAWVTFKTLVASGTGKWSVSFKPTVRGATYFRATFAGDSEWLASASTYRRVLVR